MEGAKDPDEFIIKYGTGRFNMLIDNAISLTEFKIKVLKQNYNLVPKGNGFYIVTENVECVCDGAIEKLKFKPELINGYLCQNIYEYLNYLEIIQRKKDKSRITIVKDYINNIEEICITKNIN